MRAARNVKRTARRVVGVMVEMELAFLPSFLLIIWPDGSRCSIVSILGSNAPIYAVNVFLNAATVLRRCLLQSPIIVQGRLLFPALLAFPLFLSRFRHHLSLRRRGDSSNRIDFQTASAVSNAALAPLSPPILFSVGKSCGGLPGDYEEHVASDLTCLCPLSRVG